MADILKELLEFFPEGKISDAGFEGANIMLYTTDKNFFLNNEGIIRKVVSHFKKRVELRPDPSITMDPEKAKAIIEQIIPQEAKMDNIIFDKFRSQVIIETEKPGLCIGKQGALLQEIREKTLWVPIIKRTPPIRSLIIEKIREVIYVLPLQGLWRLCWMPQ